MEFKHELIIPNQDLPFKMFLFEGNMGNYSVAKHWHQSVEIFAVISGDLKLYINTKEYNLTSGSFVVINANEVHSIQADNTNETIVLQIPVPLFHGYQNDNSVIRFHRAINHEENGIMSLITNMYRTYEQKENGYDLKVLSNFYELMYIMVTRYLDQNVKDAVKIQNHNLNKLSLITDYINQNCRQTVTLEKTARVFGYSPEYLSRMFQKYAKITFRDYLHNIRLEYAYRELVNTDTSISEIALNNGFPNSKALTRVFKEKYGMTPSEYRKQYK